MDQDWRIAFGILMCTEMCDVAGPRICGGVPFICSSSSWEMNLNIRVEVRG